MNWNRCLVALFFVCASEGVLADIEKEAHQHTLPIHPIKFSSYVTGSYNYLVNSPYFVSDVYDRVNDIAKNGLRLQQAYLAISSQPEGLGGMVNGMVGLDAYVYAPAGWNPNVFQLQNIGLTVTEAYLQYRHQDFTLKVGEIAALAGLESFIYTNDVNFSRSILDGYAQPGSHLTIRAIQRVNQSVGLIFGICNGWSTIRNPAALKALEFGVSAVPTDALSFTVDGYIGPDYLANSANAGPSSTRWLLDVYGTYQVSKPLKVTWNFDYGNQSKALLPSGGTGEADWVGLAGYLDYQINEQWRTSLRGEVFHDRDGYRTGVRQSWKEVTVSIGLQPLPHLSLIAETRHDFSNVDSFASSDGVGSHPNQQSYAVQALYQIV